MLCAACGHDNRPGRRFCGSCGAELTVACPACGAANDPVDRFCGACGGPVAAVGGQEPAAPAAERRVVSVLFADLVGFTPLAEARDPERVRELLAQYFEAAREVIERHGGMLEKFIGDAVVAVWGAPVAQEDDAERAVRAGLEIVDVVARLGERTQTDLRARAAVSTGAAAVTLGARGQGLMPTAEGLFREALARASSSPGDWVTASGRPRSWCT